VTRLALVRPDIHFVLHHNGRRVFNLPPADDRAQRIGEFFGREVADNLIPLRWQSPELEIDGFLLPPSISRRNTRMQYTFVNGRYVRNKTLMHAVSEAYKQLLTSGRRPVCFLFLTLAPRQVDVNVHPTKLEVRFRQSREVHQQVFAAMRDCLRQAKITPQVALTEEEPDAARESVRRAVGDFFAGQGRGDARSQTGVRRGSGSGRSPETEPRRQVRFGNCVQVLDSFIVEEVADGLNIIDQHALHERILYNRIKRRLAEGRLNSQQLLVPDVVELPKQEFYAVMDLQEELARFGLEMESFGDRSVIVRAFPQILGKFDAKSFFEELLAELEGPGGARKVDGRLEKIEQMMACKAAVKAGQRLSPRQLQHLLEERDESGETGTCPHGRPTTIYLSRHELDKQFHRT
jgi:DNA mismatch repair protein MutL